MEIKNKKMVIGVAAMGIGFIAKEIRNRKKIKELDFKINSMNKSMGVFADAHNAFVEKATSEFKETDNVITDIIDQNEFHYDKILNLEKITSDHELELDYLSICDELDDEEFTDEFDETKEDYCVNERLDRIEDEIGSVYEHIEKLATEGK